MESILSLDQLPEGWQDKIRFVCSAIKFQAGKEYLIQGKRHHNCIYVIKELGLTKAYQKTHSDGFVVDLEGKEYFIDRELATAMAQDLGIEMIGCVLTSEDLW